jgi:alanine dehydrogenase
VTLPYAVALAEDGWETAVRRDSALALGVNLVRGDVVNAAVADAHGLPSAELSTALS